MGETGSDSDLPISIYVLSPPPVMTHTTAEDWDWEASMCVGEALELSLEIPVGYSVRMLRTWGCPASLRQSRQEGVIGARAGMRGSTSPCNDLPQNLSFIVEQRGHEGALTGVAGHSCVLERTQWQTVCRIRGGQRPEGQGLLPLSPAVTVRSSSHDQPGVLPLLFGHM